MNEQYDVAILGAGFEGSMLGIILACNGAKVVIVDAGDSRLKNVTCGDWSIGLTPAAVLEQECRLGLCTSQTELTGEGSTQPRCRVLS